MWILWSIKKSWKLRKLSKVLGFWATKNQPTEQFVEHLIQDFQSGNKKQGKADRALQELMDLCEADPKVSAVLTHYGTDRHTLLSLYRDLEMSGAGTWVAGHWVPASALAFAPTLCFVLEKQKRGELVDRGQKIAAAWRVLRYFERGEVGPIDLT